MSEQAKSALELLYDGLVLDTSDGTPESVGGLILASKDLLEFAGGEYNKQALNTFNSLYTKAYNSGNLKLKDFNRNRVEEFKNKTLDRLNEFTKQTYHYKQTSGLDYAAAKDAIKNRRTVELFQRHKARYEKAAKNLLQSIEKAAFLLDLGLAVNSGKPGLNKLT